MIALLPLNGCKLERKSRLEGVRHAALKIQSRTATGVNRIEYPQVISELAYEILLARDQILDHEDSEGLKKYAEALEIYSAAKDVWECNQQYKDCLKSLNVNSCTEVYRPSAQKAAAKAQVSTDAVYGDNAVQTVWQVAEQKVQAAETIRNGLALPTTKTGEQH